MFKNRKVYNTSEAVNIILEDLPSDDNVSDLESSESSSDDGEEVDYLCPDFNVTVKKNAYEDYIVNDGEGTADTGVNTTVDTSGDKTTDPDPEPDNDETSNVGSNSYQKTCSATSQWHVVIMTTGWPVTFVI